MKKFFFAVLTATVLFSCNSKKEENKTENTTAGNDKPADDKKMANTPKPDSATMMKNWQDYMTPGDVHKRKYGEALPTTRVV